MNPTDQRSALNVDSEESPAWSVSSTNGEGTSGAGVVSTVWASETDAPSRTSLKAALRRAGVRRLAAPSPSFAPRRPQSRCRCFQSWMARAVDSPRAGASPGGPATAPPAPSNTPATTTAWMTRM